MFQDPCEISGMYINQPTRVVCLFEATRCFWLVFGVRARLIFLSGEFATPLKINMEQKYEPGFKNGK